MLPNGTFTVEIACQLAGEVWILQKYKFINISLYNTYVFVIFHHFYQNMEIFIDTDEFTFD